MVNLRDDIELVEEWIESENPPLGLEIALQNVIEAAWRYDDLGS